MFLCKCPFKYVTQFHVDGGCWFLRTENWPAVFEGTVENCVPVCVFQAIRGDWEKRPALLKKLPPSQPTGNLGLRLGQVPTKQPNVCKTSTRMKRLGLQRHPKVATVLEDVSELMEAPRGAGAERQTCLGRAGSPLLAAQTQRAEQARADGPG